MDKIHNQISFYEENLANLTQYKQFVMNLAVKLFYLGKIQTSIDDLIKCVRYCTLRFRRLGNFPN
jgi:hypothetical protein